MVPAPSANHKPLVNTTIQTSTDIQRLKSQKNLSATKLTGHVHDVFLERHTPNMNCEQCNSSVPSNNNNISTLKIGGYVATPAQYNPSTAASFVHKEQTKVMYLQRQLPQNSIPMALKKSKTNSAAYQPTKELIKEASIIFSNSSVVPRSVAVNLSPSTPKLGRQFSRPFGHVDSVVSNISHASLKSKTSLGTLDSNTKFIEDISYVPDSILTQTSLKPSNIVKITKPNSDGLQKDVPKFDNWSPNLKPVVALADNEITDRCRRLCFTKTTEHNASVTLRTKEDLHKCKSVFLTARVPAFRNQRSNFTSHHNKTVPYRGGEASTGRDIWWSGLKYRFQTDANLRTHELNDSRTKTLPIDFVQATQHQYHLNKLRPLPYVSSRESDEDMNSKHKIYTYRRRNDPV